MEFLASTSPSVEEVRTYVANHLDRNPGCELTHILSGWRVKFGRPIGSAEAALVQEIYEEESDRRWAQLEAELAEAEARRPKGFGRILAMGWIGQMTLGTVIFLGALYGGCIAFYPVIARGTLFGGTAATGAPLSVGQPALSAGSQSLVVAAFENPGVQAASSFLFWTVLVTGGVGGVVILLIGWGIGHGVIRGLRRLLRRPAS